jgi:hypothetical protein
VAKAKPSPPQRRPTLLLRACIYCALVGERRQVAADGTKKTKEEKENKKKKSPHARTKKIRQGVSEVINLE